MTDSIRPKPIRPPRRPKKRGPGRPPIWKQQIIALKKRQHIVAKDRNEAMTIYVCGHRMAVKIHVERQPDGTYHCTR